MHNMGGHSLSHGTGLFSCLESARKGEGMSGPELGLGQSGRLEEGNSFHCTNRVRFF